ncbi:hypothetical protein [Pseudoalteromonas 'SMAR']|uniref:hypothetical protein n=1 Tax=Pseudoalteromonas 'SMAR' TaxID=3416908 RepID=UPI003AF1E2D0
MSLLPFRFLHCPGFGAALWYCRMLFACGIFLIAFGVFKEAITMYYWAVNETAEQMSFTAAVAKLDLLSHPNIHLVIIGMVKVYFSCGLAVKIKMMSGAKQKPSESELSDY